MENLKTIARPYAQAVFSIALKDKSFSVWQDRLTFFSAVAKEPSMRQFVSGVLSTDKSLLAFSEVCREHADESSRRLLEVMASNQRLNALPEVAEHFSELYLQWLKEIEVEVVSAYPLTSEQELALQQALEKRFSQKIKLNCHLDTDLIGGLRIKIGDEVIDGSLRDKLTRMKKLLQS